MKKGNFCQGYSKGISCTPKRKINGKLIHLTVLALGVWGLATICPAQVLPQLPRTRVCPILDRKEDLGLSDSQTRRLQLVVKSGQQKMLEARSQAEIRLQEISKSSRDWANLNGLAIRNLIKEYYGFLADYMASDLECITNASKVLDRDQLALLGKLLSPDSLQLNPSSQIVRVTAGMKVTKNEAIAP